MTNFTPNPARVQELARLVLNQELTGACVTEHVDSWAGEWPEHATLGPAEFAILVYAVTTEMKHIAGDAFTGQPGTREIAASLNDTARHLQDHIDRRAQEIAEPQILAVRLAAKTRMDDMERETRFELQRKSNLIAELRRQLDHAGKSVERLDTEVKATRAAIRRVEALHVWTNEDDRKFVFADDLWAALAETSSYGKAITPATKEA